MKGNNKSAVMRIGFAAFIISVLVISANSVSIAGRRTWPSFELIYRVEGYYRGVDGSYGVQRYRVTYTDQNHWATEILEPSQSSLYPAGTKNTYSKMNNSEVTTRFDPKTGKEFSSSNTSDGTQLLDEWAWPGYITGLIKRFPSVVITDAAKPSELVLSGMKAETGYKQITLNDFEECDNDRESSLQMRKVPGLTLCGKGRSYRTEITFDDDLNLLLERVDFVDGIQIERHVVESLSFQ